MGRKLLSIAVLGWLLFAPGAPVCAALMAGAQSADPHDCCEKPKERSHDETADCELLCAIAGEATLAADNGIVEQQDTALWAAAPTLCSFTPTASAPERRFESRPPNSGPPLYVLHAVFLI